MLELLALGPYLPHAPFELRDASLQCRSSSNACAVTRLDPQAEHQYRVVHISGRTNPADFLARRRFRDGPGPARSTGHDDPDSELGLFAGPL